MVFGAHPVVLLSRDDAAEDLLFVQETSLSGQFVKQWRHRAMAKEAAIKEAPNNKLRGLPAHKKSRNCTNIATRNSALAYKTVNRKGAPVWRAPAKILDIDETGVAVKFQSQPFTAKRNCVRTNTEEKDVSEVDWSTASGTRDLWSGSPPRDLGTGQKLMGAPREAGGVRWNQARTRIWLSRSCRPGAFARPSSSDPCA